MHPNEYPLPTGWVKQFDQTAQLPFYVDTNAKPPRSIWTHPYEDEKYLSEHPEIRKSKSEGDEPPSFEEATGRHSHRGQSSSATSSVPDGSHASQTDIARSNKQKRGFFGKIKDKAVGTKEEREARKRQEEEHRRLMLERRRQQMSAAPPGMYGAPDGYGGNYAGGDMYGAPQYGTPQYGAPQYGPAYGPQYAQPGYNNGNSFGGRRGGGMGGMGGMGMGLPILGGLAGGLLLGDLLGGGFGDGFGGGDFGGGDFGGGGF